MKVIKRELKDYIDITEEDKMKYDRYYFDNNYLLRSELISKYTDIIDKNQNTFEDFLVIARLFFDKCLYTDTGITLLEREIHEFVLRSIANIVVCKAILKDSPVGQYYVDTDYIQHVEHKLN